MKAESPIDVTLSGIVIVVRLEQSLNADEPMKVSIFGSATVDKLEQP